MCYVPFNAGPQQGWQCPVCKAVYAPFFPQCTRCGKNEQQTTVGTSTGTPFPKPGYEIVSDGQTCHYREKR